MRNARARMKIAAAVASTTALALGLTACGDSGGGSTGSSSQGGVTTLTWQMWSGSQVETDALNHLS